MSLFPSAQNSLQFPQPLTEKYRPRRILDFIGLDKQRKILSAFAKRPVSCAWLFIGGSGLGKSTMALALAEELKVSAEYGNRVPRSVHTLRRLSVESERTPSEKQ